MPIQVKCPNPSCGKSLRVNDELAGKTVRCPACKNALKLPAATPAPVPAAQPAAKKAAPAPAAAARAPAPAPAREKANGTRPARPPADEEDRARPAGKAKA